MSVITGRIQICPIKRSRDTFSHNINQFYTPHHINITNFTDSLTTMSFSRSLYKKEILNPQNEGNNALNPNLTFKTL